MEVGPDGKPCRACISVDQLMKQAKEFVKKAKATDEGVDSSASSDTSSFSHSDCPVDKDQLGRSTWDLLHTMTVYYPETPSEEHKKAASSFMDSLSKTYPCDFCAKDLRENLKKDPPKVATRKEFALWMCQLHNKVNKKTGKPEFDCSKVFERWKDGWKDGSCDD
ncbi:unnamed protein product [Nippostrongylus brasiliensis]|uniref:Sulfhydryl oxidase n=1 Tax=Nippostrongylus brasiliensis TaxID=27835 RepID=A0A0N4Y1W6_NIPBR|nr:unnamed protein product [Nippostrongylus brasiliensis]